MSTPRDLATYVHFDALYEAYLNACMILLAMGTPSDPACDHLSGVGSAAGSGQTRRHAGGFALYGGHPQPERMEANPMQPVVTLEAPIVQIADAISASRPGARGETMDESLFEKVMSPPVDPAP